MLFGIFSCESKGLIRREMWIVFFFIKTERIVRIPEAMIDGLPGGRRRRGRTRARWQDDMLDDMRRIGVQAGSGS